ncbi:LacI family DNA-binding transcriptional regulator [Pseudomonas japonica]|uniref:LacI family DNA-binding transcriptional regulator n=1 Tax=Pseudomonas japonica TaxID=256466 RepID=UPI0015E397AF|nr:LacI family DNA-binding transcriptional regulator [Pseudomonas japonica]MBA1290511.1 LacI family transcriptional regulator [Pseudomonas japonica]
MATIKDVAALAGISYTTVSHVVNNTRPVSDAVRIKVEAAIAELAYVPSGVARSLKARATATIGLVLPNNINPYFAELARGIEDACERNGYCVILCNSDDDPRKQRSYLRVLQEKRVDGLLLAAVDSGVACSDWSGMTTPMVVVDREMPGVDADLVCIDHAEGAYLATRHLLQLGHRRIACVNGPAGTTVARLRQAGFDRAMAEAGVAVPAHWRLAGDFSADGGYRAGVALFGERPPSAVFAANDMLGMGLLRAAAERKLAVPRELSVIGFDDIQMCRYVYPALTTVGQSILALGELAAECLLARIQKRESSGPRRHVVAPTIVPRESTAPPQARMAAQVCNQEEANI